MYLPCSAPSLPVKRAAERMRTLCCRELGIKFRVRWIRHAYASASDLERLKRNSKNALLLLLLNQELKTPEVDETTGRALKDVPGVIFVNAALSPFETALAVAHEGYHRKQYADGIPYGHGGKAELEARNYEAGKRALARQIVQKRPSARSRSAPGRVWRATEGW